MAHTPGPWKVGTEKHFGTVAVRCKDGVVCSLLAKPGAVGDDMRQANARLIALAPKMFALLEKWARFEEHDYDQSGDLEWKDETDALIAEANG